MKQGLNIRKVQYKDIEKIRVWRNQQMSVLRQDQIVSKQKQKKYFNSKIFNQKKPKNILYFIKHNDSDIGYGGLTHISLKNKKAEISFLLKTSISKKKGCLKYYKYFLNFLKKKAFKDLKLKKLYTETYSFRKKYIQFYKKYGFKLKKTTKNSINLKNKKYHSLFFEINKR